MKQALVVAPGCFHAIGARAIARHGFSATIKVMLAALLGTGVLTGPACGQGSFPTRPITFVVPSAAGGGIDAAARFFADKLKDKLGQPVVVENRSGADGLIALTHVVRSKPDGYTLLVTNSYFVTGPLTLKSFNVDQVSDLASVAPLAMVPGYLISSSAAPFQNLQEMVEYAKANPGKLNFGSGQTAILLESALVFDALGIKATAINYNGSSPLMRAILTKEIDITWVGYASIVPYSSDNRLNVLATLMPKRSPRTPQVATISEQYPAFAGTGTTFGVSGPKGTPEDVVNKLNGAFNELLRDPEVQARFKSLTWDAVEGPPERWREIQASDREKFRRAARLLNLQPQ